MTLAPRRWQAVAAAAFGTVLLAGPWATGAGAHERRSVGPVQMTVGWLNEPAYAGILNAVQLRIGDEGGPVTVLGDALKVEVRFGDQKVGPMTLAPAFGSPGEYRSPMIPSRPGSYIFHFVGSVGGQQIDQSFTSSDTTFESPKEPTDIEFPVKDPTPAQLAGRLERLEPRIDTLSATAHSEAGDARDAAGRATVIAVAGLLVGAVGVALAVAGRRHPATGDAVAGT
jgi:hypothetical protein